MLSLQGMVKVSSQVKSRFDGYDNSIHCKALWALTTRFLFQYGVFGAEKKSLMEVSKVVVNVKRIFIQNLALKHLRVGDPVSNPMELHSQRLVKFKKNLIEGPKSALNLLHAPNRSFLDQIFGCKLM